MSRTQKSFVSILVAGLLTLFIGSAARPDGETDPAPTPKNTSKENPASPGDRKDTGTDPEKPGPQTGDAEAEKKDPPAGKNPITQGPSGEQPIGREREVVVTATRSDEELLAVPQVVTVATRKEIDRRAASSTALMLREEPGVWVQRTGTSGGALILRGQIGQRVLYLVDGVRINNGALFGGPNSFFNTVQPWAVERIEVIRGPGSLQYGSDAIGGVANILTRRVTDYPAEGVAYGGDIHGQYGSVDESETADGYAWAAGHGFSILAGGGTQQFLDYVGGGDAGRIANTGYRAEGYYVKGGWRPSEDQLFELSYQTFERRDVEQYLQSKTNASRVPTLFTPRETRDLTLFRYEGRKLASFLTSLDSYAYYQSFDSLANRTTESATRFDRRDTTADQWMAGGGLTAVTPFHFGRDHRIIWGGDYRHEDLASDVLLVSTTKATGSIVASKPQGNTPDGTYDVWDGFLSLELSLADRLTTTLGVRHEVTNLDSRPTALDAGNPFTVRDLEIRPWYHATTWSAGTVWSATDEIALTANVATGFRAPTYSDALSFSVPTFSTTTVSVPSPDVSPERAITYEFGPRYDSDLLTGTVNFYYTHLDQLIANVARGSIFVPGIGVRRAQGRSNEGHGYVRGLDADLSVRPLDGLTVFGSISYAEGRDQFLNKPARFVPPLNGRLGVQYEANGPHAWWAETNLRFVNRYIHHAPDDEQDAAFAEDPGLGSPNTTTNRPLRAGFELPGYVLWNFRAGVEVFRTGKAKGNLSLSIDNILDREYRETFSRQILDPGRNATVTFDIRF